MKGRFSHEKSENGGNSESFCAALEQNDALQRLTASQTRGRAAKACAEKPQTAAALTRRTRRVIETHGINEGLPRETLH